MSLGHSRLKRSRIVRPAHTINGIELLEDRRLLTAALAHREVAWLSAAPAITVVPVLPSPTQPVSPTGGVTIDETAGVPFTAIVGSFDTTAPANTLHAEINWGDGTPATVGTIIPTAVSGVDAVHFNVAGSHTYANAGTFPILTTITQSLGPPGSAAPIRLITTIKSTAVVTPAKSNLKLDGTITGTYSLAPTAVSVGALYLFNGTGVAGAMGPVQATGRVQLPPPLGTPTPVASATRVATGTLTLNTISATGAANPLPGGSVTLQLTGPVPVATSAVGSTFPPVLSYTITGGTGAFANATGTGTINVVLGPNGLTFTFTIHSN